MACTVDLFQIYILLIWKSSQKIYIVSFLGGGFGGFEWIINPEVGHNWLAHTTWVEKNLTLLLLQLFISPNGRPTWFLMVFFIYTIQ